MKKLVLIAALFAVGNQIEAMSHRHPQYKSTIYGSGYSQTNPLKIHLEGGIPILFSTKPKLDKKGSKCAKVIKYYPFGKRYSNKYYYTIEGTKLGSGTFTVEILKKGSFINSANGKPLGNNKYKFYFKVLPKIIYKSSGEAIR